MRGFRSVPRRKCFNRRATASQLFSSFCTCCYALVVVACLGIAPLAWVGPFPQPDLIDVSCFGDSHTEGIFGAPWVPSLAQKLQRRCCNYGQNMWTAESVYRRALVAQPSEEATVLVGSNDVMMDLARRAGNHAMLILYKTSNGLPLDYQPTVQTFAAAFRRLVLAVPARRIVVASLPPLGESLCDEANAVIQEYNAKLREVINEDPRIIYAPFNENLPQTADSDVFDASYVGFAATISQMYWHTALRWLPCGQSFDSLAATSQRCIVHDKIHLTEASAALLTELFAEALERPMQAM